SSPTIGLSPSALPSCSFPRAQNCNEFGFLGIGREALAFLDQLDPLEGEVGVPLTHVGLPFEDLDGLGGGNSLAIRAAGGHGVVAVDDGYDPGPNGDLI